MVTTNYDSLLEVACAKEFSSQPRVSIGANAAPALADVWQPRLAKAHGDLSVPDSIVLSRNDYLHAIHALRNTPRSVWAEFGANPTLAVGYSARDLDFQLMSHWFATSLRGFAQPIFILTADERREELSLLRNLGNVTPVPYRPYPNHEVAVAAVIERLVAERTALDYVRGASAAEISLLRRMSVAAGAAAHELNNALGVILGHAEMLKEDTSLTPSQREHIQAVLGAGRGAATETMELLRIGRSSRERLTQCRWRDCRSAIAEALRTRPSYSIVTTTGLTADRHSDIPIGAHLCRVLVCVLIDNALEATRGVRTPTVRLSVIERRSDAGVQLEVSVSDNGCGIPEDVERRLFRPGVSSKGEGRGFGLFFLKAVVEECGGSIGAHRRRSGGTSVHMRLPAVPHADPTLQDNSTSVPTKAPSPTGKTIVVLDDDQDIGMIVARGLTSAGYQCVVFLTAGEATSWLTSTSIEPVAFVGDVVLGDGVSGIDVLAHARRRFPSLPAVFMSGFLTHRQVTETVNAAFLAKPFAIETLRETVERVVSLRASDGASSGNVGTVKPTRPKRQQQ